MNRASSRKRKFDTMLRSSAEGSQEGTSKNTLVCDLCKITLPNESSMKQHLLGQKHKKLESTAETRRPGCGIFARGFPRHLSESFVLNYFAKYGEVSKIFYRPPIMLLDYREPLSAQNLLKEVHYLGRKLIRINIKRDKRGAVPNLQKVEEKLSAQPVENVRIDKPNADESTDYIDRIKDIPKFDDQVQMLIQHLLPDVQEQFPKYRKICCDLHEVLSYSFPWCEIHPFGSTITGLHFKNSDIDVYIEGIRRHQDNDKPHLYRMKSILLNSQRFANVIVIGRAKIPILKCVHVETGISCDFNLRNKLGVCNSQLINYYLNIDPKVRHLMVFLKYWAKVHKFTGQGHLFSNYALIMMLIFFLQQMPDGVPPVLALQQNSHSFRFHDGWNGGFEPIPVNSAYLRRTSLVKLLEEFFAFYADFEYGSNVICPFLGTPLPKHEFISPEVLPDCFQPYKMYLEVGNPLKVDTTICIQDPFEHCRNNTPVGTPAELGRFVLFCQLGKKLCQDGENLLLYNLLTMSSPDSKSQVVVKPELSKFSIPMRPNLKYIEEKIENTLNRHEAIRMAWFENVVGFTKTVLKDILKFELTELDDPTKVKNNKSEGQSDVYGAEKHRVSYRCIGRINLWQNRKAAAKTNRTGMDEKNQGVIKREVAITEQLCTTYKDIPQTGEVINFEITLENKLTPSEAVVNIKKISAYKNIFKSFAVFLSANLCNWFDMYEKELNLCTS